MKHRVWVRRDIDDCPCAKVVVLHVRRERVTYQFRETGILATISLRSFRQIYRRV